MQQNYFELFGILSQYKIDKEALKEKYHQLQQQYHPDKDHKNEHLNNEDKIKQVNTAYNTLKDNSKRALYLLKLKGYDLMEDNRTIPNSQLIQDIMRIREEIEIISDLVLLYRYRDFLEEEISKYGEKFAIASNDEEAINNALEMHFRNQAIEECDKKITRMIESLIEE